MGARGSLIIGLAAVVVVSVGPGNVVAQDPVAVAETAAKATASTPEGKKYEEEVGAAFGRDQGKNIQACAKEVKRPDLSVFQVFVRVSGAGQVEEGLVKPRTNLAACLEGKLKTWKLGVPPRADLWVGIEVNLKAK